jgi:hypothetical protein
VTVPPSAQPPGPPPADEPPAARPSMSSRRRWLIVSAAVVAVLIVAGLVLFLTVGRGDSEQAKVREVVDEFAVAVDQADRGTIIKLLCTEEAGELAEDDDDPAPDGGPAAAGAKASVEVSDIRVTGDVASARVKRPSQAATTLYFRKEAGVWKVCAPAGDAVSASPSPAG